MCIEQICLCAHISYYMMFPWVSFDSLPIFQPFPVAICALAQKILMFHTWHSQKRFKLPSWTLKKLVLTPGKLAWLARKSTMNENVFPIEHEDFPLPSLVFGSDMLDDMWGILWKWRLWLDVLDVTGSILGFQSASKLYTSHPDQIGRLWWSNLNQHGCFFSNCVAWKQRLRSKTKIMQSTVGKCYQDWTAREGSSNFMNAQTSASWRNGRKSFHVFSCRWHCFLAAQCCTKSWQVASPKADLS